jgi:hypothetical protein
VFGIISLIFCGCLLGIPAWIIGSSELKKISRGESSPEGKGFATAGMWLGIISTAISVVGVFIYVLLMMAGLKD